MNQGPVFVPMGDSGVLYSVSNCLFWVLQLKGTACKSHKMIPFSICGSATMLHVFGSLRAYKPAHF